MCLFVFDSKERAKITAKKTLAMIAERDEAAQGVAPSTTETYF